MSSNNMINPANYYNPFAKYDYVSKTRGVYMPKNAEPLLKADDTNTAKSASIYSDNYDAEADLMESMNADSNLDSSVGLLGFVNKLFKQNEN